MRFVLWNIERGYHPQGVASTLRNLDADVYLLYELDRGVRRTKEIDMVAYLESALDRPSYYTQEFIEIDSIWRRIIPWGGPGGGEIGNAIFTRHPVLNHTVVSLPTSPRLTYDRSTLVPELFQPRVGSRKAQQALIQIGHTRVQVVSTHLELWKAGWELRQQQLEAAYKVGSDVPCVIGGDFNNVQGSVWASLLRLPGSGEVAKVRNWLRDRGLADPYEDSDTTCGRLGVRAKIDWIAGTSDLKVEAVRKIRTAFSDHDCLVVDYHDPTPTPE